MSKDRISLYREAMQLESDRERLQLEIARVSSRLAKLQNQLFTATAPLEESVAIDESVAITPVRSKRKGRARRGELTAQIREALSEAGTSGVRVQDLAETLGVKPANIHAWFQNAAKRIPQIKKIGRGQYRLDGAVAAKPAAESPVKAAKGKPAGKRGKGGKRGALAAQIEKLLKGAGSAGTTIKDLAAMTGVKYRNLSVWFSTTGKKNKAIKKVGPGHYRIA